MNKVIISKSAYSNLLELVGCIYSILLFHSIKIRTVFITDEMREEYRKELLKNPLVPTTPIYLNNVSLHIGESFYAKTKEGKKICIILE